MNPWLGARRGHLSDWTTQQWVRRTGRRVDLREEAWLDNPAAPTTGSTRTSSSCATALRLWRRRFLRLLYAMQPAGP